MVLRPTTLAELRDAVRDTGGGLLVSGAGTAAGWAGVPTGDPDALDLTGLDRTLDYRPDDLTVAVQAGMPLSRLQEELAARGQRIALDAARVPAGATVGGLLATADAGPLRHAYGGPRDLVIGVTLVLADGTVARSGGQVIKNVAGYDLAKLCCGSFGTLAVIAEVVLRVHPLPAATRTAAIPCDAAGVLAQSTRILEARLEPAALEWCDGVLLARFEGVEAGGPMLDGEDEAAAWRRSAAVSTGEVVVRCGTRPSRLPGLVPAGAQVTSSVAVGVHTMALGGDGAAAAVARIRDASPHVTLCRRPPDVDIPAWGAPHAAVPLLRAVKRRFDPDGRLGAGRFAPWF
jgi:glycolate oxidase FAD binding subunit